MLDGGAQRDGPAPRAWALAWLYMLATGCGAEPVHARAIWVDDTRGDGRRRIHVYDRGELESFEVLGKNEPIERVLLDPRGHGLVIRSGESRSAWFDLDRGRRLSLLLPPLAGVGFGDRALIWIDHYSDGALTVVPLGLGLDLPHRDGTVEPLQRAAGLSWWVAAEQAPIVLVGAVPPGGASESRRASFFRYPTEVDQPLAIALEAAAEGLELPTSAEAVVVDPLAELAMYSIKDGGEGPWGLFDRRSPESAGPLELPPELTAGQNLRLVAALDRWVSIWSDDRWLHHYDRSSGSLDSLPILTTHALSWTTVERGRAVVLSSIWGPVYRADLTGLRPISLDSTVCAGASPPVVSPTGRFVAWTCSNSIFDLEARTGAVVRVSARGLERYAGVPMAPVAIDDDGDLLLYSGDLVGDTLDVIGSASTVPRSLFVLSGDGVLTRVDDLEPPPAPVLLESSGNSSSYIQGAALR